MRENDKGFFLFFDWIDDLDHSDAADAWAVVKALCGYYREGINPVEAIDGPMRVVVSIMFHQIKRAERISAQRAQNARDTNEKKKAKEEILRTQSERRANAERTLCDATEYRILNTSSFTHSIASARTCEGNEDGAADDADGDLLPPGARHELEQHLKEDVKREYLGGTLGRGRVLLSGEQFDKLCDELSRDELEKYIGVVADCEESGKHYTNKTHYQAIMEMARADRRV